MYCFFHVDTNLWKDFTITVKNSTRKWQSNYLAGQRIASILRKKISFNFELYLTCMLFWFVKHTLMVGAYQKGYRCFMIPMFYILIQYCYCFDIEEYYEMDYFHGYDLFHLVCYLNYLLVLSINFWTYVYKIR